MCPEIFAEWLQRQGYKVVRSMSSYWVEVTPAVLQAFPYHWLIQPDENELNQLLASNRAVGLRYSAPITFKKGTSSYHVIYDDIEYELSMLPKKARYDVRKGIANFSIEEISFERLAIEGWQLREDTLVRQGRQGAESRSWWEKLCSSAEGLPGIEAWAAIKDGNLAAALIAISCAENCSILYQQSRTQYLKEGVNNALTFTFSQDVMSRPTIKKIFYGLQSLDAPVSVDEFKFRMGYKANPVRQRVVFNQYIAPVFNRMSYKLLKYILRFAPGFSSLSKAEGMLRFYLEGNRPLADQFWPEPLAGNKDSILAVLEESV